MLSGQYDFLVENMWLAEIIAIVLLILPVFLVFMKEKWFFFYYAISIVANLPLIFVMVFGFSYEAIIGFFILFVLIKDIIKRKNLRYLTTKENKAFIIIIIIIMLVNLGTAFFNFNGPAFMERLFNYIVSIFILFVYTYYFRESKKIKFIKNGILVGGVILVISMIIELIYGHFIVGLRNMRPGGLLLDPNVCGFALNIVLVLSFLEREKGKFINDLLIVASRMLLIFGVFLTVSRSAYLGTLFVLVCYMVYYSRGKRSWIVPSVTVVFIVMYLICYPIINNFFKNIYNILDLKRIIPYSGPLDPPGGNGPGGGVITEPGVDYSNSRIDLLIAAIKIFGNNFITGVGIGNVTTKINNYTNLPMNAHNLFLQLLAESGIIMLIAFLFFAYYLFNLLGSIEKRFKFFIWVIFGLLFLESMFNHNLLNINLTFLVLSIVIGLISVSSCNRINYVITRENFKIKKKSFK